MDVRSGGLALQVLTRVARRFRNDGGYESQVLMSLFLRLQQKGHMVRGVAQCVVVCSGVSIQRSSLVISHPQRDCFGECLFPPSIPGLVRVSHW